MNIDKVKAVYFSPAGHTELITRSIGERVAEKFGVTMEEQDFTLPENRREVTNYGSGELVVFGVPVYAGRVPNKILPDVENLFKGNETLAVPVVVFGNRAYDNALIELRNVLEDNGFHTIAGGAFVAEHVYSDIIAPGRPDADDMAEIEKFADAVAEKVTNAAQIPEKIEVAGTEPIPPYYTPLGVDGKPTKFLKAKPKTRENCNQCGICVKVCPMGSIDADDPTVVSGVCIKCQACVQKCPIGAKYFDDEAFLSHVRMLEENYLRRAENSLFV